jgi:hypothetical protein
MEEFYSPPESSFPPKLPPSPSAKLESPRAVVPGSESGTDSASDIGEVEMGDGSLSDGAREEVPIGDHFGSDGPDDGADWRSEDAEAEAPGVLS